MANDVKQPMIFLVMADNKGNYQVAAQGKTRWTTCSNPMPRDEAEKYARSLAEVLEIELES